MYLNLNLQILYINELALKPLKANLSYWPCYHFIFPEDWSFICKQELVCLESYLTDAYGGLLLIILILAIIVMNLAIIVLVCYIRYIISENKVRKRRFAQEDIMSNIFSYFSLENLHYFRFLIILKFCLKSQILEIRADEA